MMAPRQASELAHRLGREAEAVCREYLSAGRRAGNYWLVGDARNTPGRSLYVRLKDSAKGPAGKWTDYVAAAFMLRLFALMQWSWLSADPAQHNLLLGRWA